MRILIEGETLVHERRTGVQNYAHGLVRALAESGPDEKYVVAHFSAPTRRGVTPLEGWPTNVRERRIWWIPGRVSNRFLDRGSGIPLDLAAGVRADILLGPYFERRPTLSRRIRAVTVVHDLVYREHPEYLSFESAPYLERQMRRTILTSDRLVAVSHSTARLLAHHYGLDVETIAVVPPAVDHELFRPPPAADVERVRRRHGIDGPYVLSVATLEPRKNLDGLLAAWGRLAPAVLASHTLVLTGGRGSVDAGIDSRLERLRAAGGRVVVTGYVEQHELPALFGGAAAFAYPSHHEGFGMPIAEAMACGAPVICGDSTSMPEVGGDAVLPVPSRDVNALADALTRTLNDRELAAGMRSRGIEQAARYTWQASADAMRAVFRSLT